MKSIRNNTLLRTLALGFLASGVGVVVANAQPLKGTFSLPSETHWGAATLKAGDYAFSSEGVKNGYTMRLIQNGKVIATVLTQGHDLAVAGPAVLVVYEGKGGPSVCEVRLPEVGVVLQYAAHQFKPGTAGHERQIADLIPITFTGTR
jgi:hypothetical protein